MIITKQNTKLKDLKLYKEDGRYYLQAIYIQEDDSGIYETTIPKISLPVYCGEPMFVTEFGERRMYQIDLGFGELNVCERDGVAFTTKTIKEKAKKMTVAEIEKKLGHKIEIISE